MNEKLRNELLSMRGEDQRMLQKLIDDGTLGTVEYHPKMKAVHERNNIRIKEIISEHGWPGLSLVGKDGAEAAWLVVQHAVLDKEFMKSCLSLLRDAVDSGEAEGWCFAYLQDRVLTMDGKPQKYGSQHDIDQNGRVFPMPIEEPTKIDVLRKELGLEPLSEATARIQERHNTIRRNRRNKQ